MIELLSLLKPLILIGFSVAIIFGIMSPNNLYKTLAIWIFSPILIGILLTYFKDIFLNLEPISKILFACIILILAIIIVSRFFLGKQVSDGVTSNFIYDILKFIFLLPFRIIRGIGRILFRR